MRKRIGAICLLLLAAVSLGGIPVCADGAYSYLYNREKKAAAAPRAAAFQQTITGKTAGTDSFRSPQDLFLAADGLLYVADTGNNRIVILDGQGKAVRIVDGFDNQGRRDAFSGPSGLFVSAAGELYVADSLNARIVQLDAQGKLMRLLHAPRAETLPEDFYFKPTKLTVDNSGRLFVVSEGFNMGLLEFHADGQFIQSIGAAKVAVNPIELLWRRLSTKEQRKRMISYVPTEYNNVAVDGEDFLFVTTSAFEYWQYQAGNIQPLCRLNAEGSDVLSRVGQPIGDLDFYLGFGDKGAYTGPSSIVDVCLMENGGYALLDQKRGRVFAYNRDGQLLYEFGGPGDYADTFQVPTSLVYGNGVFYAADSNKNQIQLFRLTEYGQLFAQAAQASISGDFAAEEALWNQIMARNANCTLALEGLGATAYRRQDMETAMRLFREAEDRENYSKAYAFVRRAWIENHAFVLLGSAAGVALLILLAVRLVRRARAKGTGGPIAAGLLYSGHVLFHPLDGFWDLKREKRGNLASALILFGAFMVTAVASSLLTGFIFNTVDLKNYNLLLELVKFIGIYLLGCVSLWCVTSLLDGEGTFTDILTAAAYSLTPYIWIGWLGILFSRVFVQNEGDFYYALLMLGIVWCVLLFITGVKQTHDYSMLKTLAVLLITAVVMLLIAFVLMLLLAISQQFIAYVRDVADEIALRL